MKIIATARSRNEERHIIDYCLAYQFADEILIADGGSTDKTVELALQYPKVKVKNYPIQVQLKDGSFRNPDGPHVQFLVDWATAEGGDWIIHQDVDQRPNSFLKRDARSILSTMEKDFLQVTQIFLWDKEFYFPDLSFQGGSWMQGLWAWRLSTGLKIIDKMPHYEFSLDGEHSLDINKTNRHLDIQPPYCFMHYGWQTEKETQEHVDYYDRTGLIPGMNRPLQFGGKPKFLENWMVG